MTIIPKILRGSLLSLVALSSACFAELRLPAVFSEGMVLQRDQKVPIWGWADAGDTVTVAFAGQSKTVKADADGQFILRLGKMDASVEPRVLSVVTGDESVEVGNILVGEVWLCSGQSNMQWSVERSKDFAEEKAAANHPQIRMFLTTLKASPEVKEDCDGHWSVCTPETVGAFSATAYFFGRELHQELNVPVGLIRSAWGGTSVEAWSPVASLEQFAPVMAYKAQQDARAANFDPATNDTKFKEQLVQWEAAVAKAKAKGKKGPKRPKKQGNPLLDQNYPGNLYNAMIHPLVPYGIRGAIWYQGERNAKTCAGAMLYRDQLENLAVQWRKDWQAEFPFYAVQLVNYKKPSELPVQDTAWAFIRESFLKFNNEVPNTGIAVGIDVGEEKDIHPKNKQAIGYRLAQQALAKTYDQGNVAGGPLYKSMKQKGGQIILKFDDIGSGLVTMNEAELKTFAIAGADKRFVPAHAEIVGDTVVVSSPEIPAPEAVRYAWADNPVGCNLYNKEGLPASPFRTDDWAPVAE